MDYSSASEWVSDMQTRSYVTTDELNAIRAVNAGLADKIERLCRATMALRGPAIVMEANSSLSYAASALAPFIVMQDAFDAAMLLKADAKQASSARQKRKCVQVGGVA
jgi:hypothetical protein